MTRAGGWTSDFMTCAPARFSRRWPLPDYVFAGGAVRGRRVACAEAYSEPQSAEIQTARNVLSFGAARRSRRRSISTSKVILIGDRSLYELLYEYEEDFRKISKVRVEFDEEMAHERRLIANMRAGCVRCREEGLYPSTAEHLPPCSNTVVPPAVQERRNKVTARFGRYCRPGARSAL